MAQEPPRDFEKRMIEESANLFSFLTQVYDEPPVDIDYVLTRLKNDGYHLLGSQGSGTYRLRDSSFYKAFERNQMVTLNDSFVEVSIEAKKASLFESWNAQLLWRLSQYGIQTNSVLSFNNEKNERMQGYRSNHKNSRHLVEISRKVEDDKNILKARFTPIDNMVIDYRSEKNRAWGTEAGGKFFSFENEKNSSSLWLQEEWKLVFGSVLSDQLDVEKPHLIVSREQNRFYLSVNNFSTGEHFDLKQERESYSRFYVEEINLDGRILDSFESCLDNEQKSLCTIEGPNLRLPISAQTLTDFFTASELDISVILPSGKSFLHLIPLDQQWKPSEKEIRQMKKDININVSEEHKY